MLDRLTKRGGWPYSYPPNCQFDINRRSEQANGILAWMPALASRGSLFNVRDLACSHDIDAGGSHHSWEVDARMGWGWSTNNIGGEWNLTNPISFSSPEPFSIRILCKTPSNLGVWTGGAGGLLGNLFTADHYTRISQIQGTSEISFRNEANQNATWAFTAVASTVYDFLFVHDGAYVTVYLNGIDQGAKAQTGNYVYRQTHNVGGSVSYSWQAPIFDLRFYGRTLSAAEAWAMSHDAMWELYAPRVQQWPVYVAAGGLTISPSGIVSLEAFGSHALSPGAVTITASAIASAETFGDGTLTLYLNPSGISTAELFGSHTVVPGAVTLAPTGLSSAEVFGSHTVSRGAVHIQPAGIASLEAFGTPLLALYVTPNGIASEEIFGSALVSLGGLTIVPVSIGSLEGFGIVRVTGGAGGRSRWEMLLLVPWKE